MDLELETWHYDNGLRWSETEKYTTLCKLEHALLLYKLSVNLGYKIYLDGDVIKQWFDKESYRGVYNATRSDKEN